jgi:hypothetical protein
MARHQFTIRTILLAAFSFALSAALFRLADLLPSTDLSASACLRVASFCSFGASVGWPVGYFFGGRSGAVVGGLIGIPAPFVAIVIWFSIFPWD